MHRNGPARSLARTLLACCALAGLAGCGSSSHGSTATGASAPSTSSTPTSSLKVTGTPRYGSPSSSAPVLSGTVQIAYRNIAIAPDTLRVRVGSTVRWSNYDPVEHNVTSEGGAQRIASGNFGEGASFQVKLTHPGVIHYRCTIHPASMNGTIEVVK